VADSPDARRGPRTVTPVAAAFAVLLGYLCGLRGKRLLESAWTGLTAVR
jgi:hypothetical protein